MIETNPHDSRNFFGSRRKYDGQGPARFERESVAFVDEEFTITIKARFAANYGS